MAAQHPTLHVEALPSRGGEGKAQGGDQEEQVLAIPLEADVRPNDGHTGVAEEGWRAAAVEGEEQMEDGQQGLPTQRRRQQQLEARAWVQPRVRLLDEEH